MKFPPKSVWQPIAIGLGILVLFAASGAVIYSMYQGRHTGSVAEMGQHDLHALGDQLTQTSSPTNPQVSNASNTASGNEVGNKTSLESRLMTLEYLSQSDVMRSRQGKETFLQLMSDTYFKDSVNKVQDFYILPWRAYGHFAMPATVLEKYKNKRLNFEDADTSHAGYPIFSLVLEDSNAYDLYVHVSDSSQYASDVSVSIKALCRLYDVSSEAGDECQRVQYVRHKINDQQLMALDATTSVVVAKTATNAVPLEEGYHSAGEMHYNFSIVQGWAVMDIELTAIIHTNPTEAIQKKIKADFAAIEKAMAENAEHDCVYNEYAGCY